MGYDENVAQIRIPKGGFHCRGEKGEKETIEDEAEGVSRKGGCNGQKE
jgi:hypothetical protein